MVACEVFVCLDSLRPKGPRGHRHTKQPLGNTGKIEPFVSHLSDTITDAWDNQLMKRKGCFGSQF